MSYTSFLILLFIGFLLGIYMMFIEPFSLKVTEHKIQTEKWNGKPIKIALLADPHMIWPWMTKNHLQKIVNKTNQLQPDLILLLGDYVGDHPFGKQLDPFDAIKPFEALEAPCGVYGVLGNHDMRLKNRHVGSWVDAMRTSSLKIMDNQSELIQCNGQSFYVAGIEDWWHGNPNIDKALLDTHAYDLPILFMTHNPDAFPLVPEEVTLTVAGHTHGGQIRLPFLGALSAVVPSKYGDKYAYGHTKEGGKDLFVSSGLGMTGIPLRFLNKPEIVVITLENNNTN